LLETEGGETAAKSQQKTGSVEDALLAKAEKINKNGDLDNKQKIEAMVELFDKEAIVQYRKIFEDVIDVTSK